jgi:hypothetical protein
MASIRVPPFGALVDGRLGSASALATRASPASTGQGVMVGVSLVLINDLFFILAGTYGASAAAATSSSDRFEES